MNSYGIEYIELLNLNDIKYGKYHYNYKSIDFMINWKKDAKKTLIVFHGTVDGKLQLPIFYKQDFNNTNTNVVCMSDKLLEYARGCLNTLFVGTDEMEFDKIYGEIIESILYILGTKINIFFGSCSGAYPAIKYGLLFNSYSIVTNGYVYVEENTMQTYRNRIKNMSNLTVKSFNQVDIKSLIKLYTPIHIYMYINKNDALVFDINKKFYLYCKDHIPNKISLIMHDTIEEGKNPHNIYFPKGQTLESIIENIN